MKNRNISKDPVRIRTKEISNGCQSIYLDIYRNGVRDYEFLKLYLIPPTDSNARMQNNATMRAAYAIKTKRTIEIANEKAGIQQVHKGITLLRWMQTYRDEQAKRGRKCIGQLNRTIALLAEYGGKRRLLREVNMEFGLGFIYYLTEVYRTVYHKPVTKATALDYYRGLCSALNAAVRAGEIRENPLNKIESINKIKIPESRREYLTIDEVKQLIATPCRMHNVKQAYLFSCFCGLRISDIEALRRENIEEEQGKTRLNIIMRKTKTPLYLPLSRQALKWMPDGYITFEPGERLFKLPSRTYGNAILKQWSCAAGINKHITYHTARHTFATMMLTLGADLYTTSKLLGHSEVRTTQVYARIINKKKDDAVNLVNEVFE